MRILAASDSHRVTGSVASLNRRWWTVRRRDCDPPQFLSVMLWIGVGGIVSGLAGPVLIGSLWPMPPEFVAEVFGDRSPAREPAPTYASTALDAPEAGRGTTSS